MSSLMFPISQRAIPKTSAQREAVNQATEVNAEGNGVAKYSNAPPIYARRDTPGPTESAVGTKRVEEQLKDEPDEPFHEMSKDARVWKTYVRETDSWDKEMVDGRNNSLDVLLIFAALFSAISTTFIVDSLGDLKPDPAESSAQTLSVMAQTLVAIANNQPALLADQNTDNTPAFSPPRSAVIVNVLWLLSLSLSVAVSLIAMLAKEWCYKFMSGRSGQIYNQARRRQQKWNGIETWKMQEVLTYLPALMHLALLLFAVGLCIYLWDINLNVAVPATVVTALGVCVYVCATILPAVDRFCPYHTPVTALLSPVQHVAFLVINILYCRVYYPGCLKTALCSIRDWFKPKEDRGRDSSHVDIPNGHATMDNVTSQILAWMITNCEDPRSVDTALQAIAGARLQLPRIHLVRCGGLELVYSRLNACIRQKQGSDEYQIKDIGVLPAALQYGRAFSVLMSGDMLGSFDGLWRTQISPLDKNIFLQLFNARYDIQHIQKNLIKYAKQENMDPTIIAAAETASVLSQRWDHQFDSRNKRLLAVSFAETAEPYTTVETLRQHIQNDSTISRPVILTLLENSVWYLVGSWPNEPKLRNCALPPIFIRMFLTCHDTAPDVACIVAVVLAATALAVHPYPGGEVSSQETEGRQKRAMQMVQHYQTNKPDKCAVHTLFMFGLIGLLPHIDLRLQGTQYASLLKPWYNVVFHKIGWSGDSYQVHGLPESFTHRLHYQSSFRKCALSLVDHPDDEAAVEVALALLQEHHSFTSSYNPELCLPALIGLRHTRTDKLRDFWLDFFSFFGSNSFSNASWHAVEQMNANGRHIVQALCNTQHEIDISVLPAFLLYFRLLVSSIMLSRLQPLDARRAALQCLLDQPAFVDFAAFPAAQVFPSDERIFAHASESTDGVSELDGMLNTMQLVTDFCYADVSPDYEYPVFYDWDWSSTLEAIEEQFRAAYFKTQPAEPDMTEQSTHLALLVQAPDT